MLVSPRVPLENLTRILLAFWSTGKTLLYNDPVLVSANVIISHGSDSKAATFKSSAQVEQLGVHIPAEPQEKLTELHKNISNLSAHTEILFFFFFLFCFCSGDIYIVFCPVTWTYLVVCGWGIWRDTVAVLVCAEALRVCEDVRLSWGSMWWKGHWILHILVRHGLKEYCLPIR